MMKRRVVVTGMGVVSPVGLDLDTFLRNVKEVRSGRSEITSFPTKDFPVKVAYPVRGFDPKPLGVQVLDPFIQFAVGAAASAIEDAGLPVGSIDPYRIGLSVSSSKGGVSTIDRFAERFRKYPSPILGARMYLNSVPNFAAQWIARKWEIRGPARCYVIACASGTAAVIEGARMVEEGTVDYCIAGASDASITPLMLAGYFNMKAMSPSGWMRPFDRRRDGFLAGEGAGMVILESQETAQARGAKIYGEVLGFAYGCDGRHAIHFSAEENALSRTVGLCLKASGLSPERIGYVNLHGTATPAGDLYEAEQMKRAFGGYAQKIPMSSIKAVTGHMLGASGSVEIIATLLSMRDGFLLPTAGLEESDPACDLDYVAGRAREAKVDKALSVSMGFGGQIAAIAVGKGH